MPESLHESEVKMKNTGPAILRETAELSHPEKSAIQQAVQEQIIECLNRFYAIESGMWGKPINALILRTIIQGKLQDRLYDISSLSESLDLPLTTIHRKVHELIKTGYVDQQKLGKSVYLIPTEKTQISMDKSFDDMLTTLKRLYAGT